MSMEDFGPTLAGTGSHAYNVRYRGETWQARKRGSRWDLYVLTEDGKGSDGWWDLYAEGYRTMREAIRIGRAITDAGKTLAENPQA
jgi:hypothetical protein